MHVKKIGQSFLLILILAVFIQTCYFIFSTKIDFDAYTSQSIFHIIYGSAFVSFVGVILAIALSLSSKNDEYKEKNNKSSLILTTLLLFISFIVMIVSVLYLFSCTMYFITSPANNVDSFDNRTLMVLGLACAVNSIYISCSTLLYSYKEYTKSLKNKNDLFSKIIFGTSLFLGFVGVVTYSNTMTYFMYDLSANYIYALVIASQFVLYYVVSGVMKNYLITDAKGSDERKYNWICSIIFKGVGFLLILSAVFYGFYLFVFILNGKVTSVDDKQWFTIIATLTTVGLYLTAVGFGFNHNKRIVHSISTFCYSIGLLIVAVIYISTVITTTKQSDYIPTITSFVACVLYSFSIPGIFFGSIFSLLGFVSYREYKKYEEKSIIEKIFNIVTNIVNISSCFVIYTLMIYTLVCSSKEVEYFIITINYQNYMFVLSIVEILITTLFLVYSVVRFIPTRTKVKKAEVNAEN